MRTRPASSSVPTCCTPPATPWDSRFDGAVGTGDAERDAAVIAYFGDGASSQGDVMEAFDFAAVNHAPVVFFCENNQYAISVPTHAPDASCRSPSAPAGFGFRGVRVDGNDVLACHAVTTAALQQARDGGGPMLIEAVTYRIGAHTTSDDPTRYREATRSRRGRAKDPLDRVRAYLDSAGTPPQFFADLDAEAEQLGEHLRERCRAMAESRSRRARSTSSTRSRPTSCGAEARVRRLARPVRGERRMSDHDADREGDQRRPEGLARVR